MFCVDSTASGNGYPLYKSRVLPSHIHNTNSAQLPSHKQNTKNKQQFIIMGNTNSTQHQIPTVQIFEDINVENRERFQIMESRLIVGFGACSAPRLTKWLVLPGLSHLSLSLPLEAAILFSNSIPSKNDLPVLPQTTTMPSSHRRHHNR